MKYRMYHLVMYNISPIQQGIQAYHAGMEYAKTFFNTEGFIQWVNNDKTIIILNGGTSNSNTMSEHYGTMNKYFGELLNNNIPCGVFYEPDLNDALSAIAFLVPEQVWDKENYPDWEFMGYKEKWEGISPVLETTYDIEYDKWVYLMGGETNVWLRQFLSQFKLA